jgi:PAS domain S-box-containing protein
VRQSGASRALDRGDLGRGIVLFAVVVAAHAAGTELAYHVNKVTSEGVPLFPAAGVTVSALLLVPRRAWPVVLVAAFSSELIGNVFLHEVAGTAIGSALSNTVEPLLGAWVVVRWIGDAPALNHRMQLVAFLAGAVVAGPVLGALVGATSTQFTPHHVAWGGVLWRWWVGDGLGVLVVGSLILASARRGARRIGHGLSGIEAAAVAAGLIAVTWWAFWGGVPALAYATIPVLGWAALRFGVIGATTGGAIVAVISDWATLDGRGLFAVIAKGSHNEALWQLQLFLGVLLLTALVLAAQVTELTEAERKLQAAEEQRKLRFLLESSPDPIVILESRGAIDYVNPQFQKLVGQDREALSGRQVVELVPFEVRDTVLGVVSATAGAPPGTRSTFELNGLGETGDRVHEAAISPLDTADGRMLVTTLRDVTAHRKAEQALREALATAETATRAKTDFLATMSHEIRTPMNGVIGLVEILGRTSLQADQREIVSTVAESASALLSLIDDILDFSKVEAGKLELEAAPLDLAELVDGVGALLASSAAAKGVELICAIDADVPESLLGDAARVRQVLFNLVGNAIKFTAAGFVRVQVNATGGGIGIAVSDTGIGIAADQQVRLFEAFVQAEQSTTRRFGGSGLGLAIVARLVGLMGGSVTVSSQPGEGSTFSVHLPLHAVERPDAPPPTLSGLRVTAVVAGGALDDAARVTVGALSRAGADVRVRPIPQAADGAADVVYVTRGALAGADDGLAQVLASSSAPLVSDRTAAGDAPLPSAAPVGTSAITGRSVVQAVAGAAGRLLAQEAPAPVAVERGKPVVLVAEDHPVNQMVISEQLASLGFDCEIADDGAVALDLVAEGRFSILLADCHMPRLDGFELTRLIRAGEAGTDRHLPIIAVTASAFESEAKRCLAAGMDEVLRKPFSLEALDQCLSRWLPDGVHATENRPPNTQNSTVQSVAQD